MDRISPQETIIMTMNDLKANKFSEELYFLMMSSPVRDRVYKLAEKYGISTQQLRDKIVHSQGPLARPDEKALSAPKGYA